MYLIRGMLWGLCVGQVSSSEAEAMALRLEEMSTSLVNQQKELERLRVLTKECAGPSGSLQRCDRDASSPRRACCEDRGTQTDREHATSGSRDDRTPFAERTRRSIINGTLGVWHQRCLGPDARDSGVLPNNHLNVAGNSDVDIQEFGAMAAEAVDVVNLVEWLLSPGDQASSIPIPSGVESACIFNEDSLKLLRSRISRAIEARASTGVIEGSVGREEVVSPGRAAALVEGWRGTNCVMHEKGTNGGMHKKGTEDAEKQASSNSLDTAIMMLLSYQP